MRNVRSTHHIHVSSQANFACLSTVSIPYLQKIGKITSIGCSDKVGLALSDLAIEFIHVRKTRVRSGVLEVTNHYILSQDALSYVQRVLNNEHDGSWIS